MQYDLRTKSLQPEFDSRQSVNSFPSQVNQQSGKSAQTFLSRDRMNATKRMHLRETGRLLQSSLLVSFTKALAKIKIHHATLKHLIRYETLLKSYVDRS